MWDIYVIGDAAYSEAILNGVASIFGSGNLATLAGIGFIVGMLITIGRGIISGGRGVNPAEALVGFVVYLALFAPTTDVRIHSTSTGTVRVVANVPFGPAAIGSLMSQIGHSVTELMEVGFAVPAMTDYGYASPIRTAALMRKASIDGVIKDGLQSDNHNLYKSFVNYISQCTMVGIQRGDLDPKAIYNSQNPLDAIQWTHGMYRTRQFDDSGVATNVPCGAAHNALKARVNADWGGTTYGKFLAPALLQNIEELDPSGGTAEARTVKKVSEIAAILTGSGITNQQLGLNMLIYEMAEQGNLAFFDEHTDASKLAAMEQVRAQRNAAWQLEADNFASVMIPLITFFENFVFAISPLMVFVVFLGAGGLSLLGKYAFLVLWVQMWMPLMAVVNLYLMMSATGSMETLVQGPAELGSFAMINYMGTEVNTWMGVAGKLLASIPAISLMLLYGTSQAATQIARGFEGSGSAASAAKAMAPDTTSVGAAHGVSPLMQGSTVGGTSISNSGERDYKIGAGGEFKSMEQSSQREALQAAERFTEAATRGYSATAQAREQGTISGSSGTSTSSNESEANKLINSITDGAMQRLSAQGINADRRTVQNAVAGALTGSGKLGLGDNNKGAALGANASASGSTQDGSTQQSSVDSAIAQTLQESHGSTKEAQMGLAKAIKADYKAGRDNSFTAGLTKEDKTSLAKSADSAVTNSAEHQATEAAANNTSLSRGADGKSIAKMAMDNAKSPAHAVAQVRQAVQMNQLEQPYKQAMQFAGEQLGLSGDQQKVWAGMAVLLGGQENGLSGSAKTAAFEDGAQIMNGAFNTSSFGTNDYSRNKGVGEGIDPVWENGAMRDNFNRHGPQGDLAPKVESGLADSQAELAESGAGMESAPGQIAQRGAQEAESNYRQNSGKYENGGGLKANHHSESLAKHDGDRANMKNQAGWEQSKGFGEYMDAIGDTSLGKMIHDQLTDSGVVNGFDAGLSSPGATNLEAPLSPGAQHLDSQIQSLGAEGALAQYIGGEAAADAIGEVRNMASQYGTGEMSPRAEFMAALSLNDASLMNNGTTDWKGAAKEGMTELAASSSELASREYVYQGGTEPEMYTGDVVASAARYNIEHGTSASPTALRGLDSANSVNELRELRPENEDFYDGRDSENNNVAR